MAFEMLTEVYKSIVLFYVYAIGCNTAKGFIAYTIGAAYTIIHPVTSTLGELFDVVDPCITMLLKKILYFFDNCGHSEYWLE